MNRWTKFILATLLILMGWFLYRQLSPVSAVAGRANPTPTYILDAGHGGEDGGAISVTGTSESQINLAITLKLEQILALYGQNTLLTRREDISIYDEGCSTLREKKVSDIRNRVALVEETSNPVLISIHQNSYTDSRYDGFQLFFAPTQGSQLLAEGVRETMCTAIDPENSREVKQIYDSVYLLNHITCPAILVECGFVTNPAEAERLETEGYQMQLAAAVAAGILNTKEG